MSTPAQKSAAFDELTAAALVFKNAIAKMGETFDPQTVGLTEWVASINATLDEIQDELIQD